MFPIVLYGILLERDPEVGFPLLGTQIATNLASGLYELYRYHKLELASGTSGSSSTTSGLEKKVESGNKNDKLGKSETKPVDPWKVDIPKIEQRVLGE